jgi:hypothetical protein
MAYSLTANNINGGFAVLGSLCFPAQASDQVVITATASPTASQNQLLLFYDDQSGSFDAFGQAAGDCTSLVNLARPVCKSSGADCDPGWVLRPGIDETFTITINEEVERQWYFVIANCDAKTGIESPVVVNKVNIKSTVGVACSTLSPQGMPDAGSAIAITFLLLLLIFFASTTVMFYKKAQSNSSDVGGVRGSTLLASARSGGYGGTNDVSAASAGHDQL